MKRVKIMLSAILVLAIVGGSLAFKAKTNGVLHCVYTSVASNASTCPIAATTSVTAFTTTDDPNFFVGTIVKDIVDPCPSQGACTTQSTFITE